jgi:hypothetical protein
VVFYEANDFPIQKIEYLRNNVWKLFKYGDLIFDELAISQLEIERQIPKQWWNDYYMGDYGEFTMFYDVVEDQYALSSTHRRKPAAQYSSLCSYFLWESR